MKLKTELMPHQHAAVEKLIGIRVGALYMEMGTGKTRTALEMIARRLAAGKIDRVLWLCPCSVRRTIAQDIIKHADEIDVDRFQIYGIESLSSSLGLYVQLRAYVQCGTCMLVVDESNLVKNSRAIRSRRITTIAQECKYRIILNGTPISRSEADLFGQWYLLDWRILGYQSFYSFAANHLEYDPEMPGRVRRVLNTNYLTEKIAPYSFQITRAECFNLPPKHYDMVYTSLPFDQSAHYWAVVENMLAGIDEQIPETIYRMFSAAQAVISGMYVEDDGKHIITTPMYADPEDNPRIAHLLEVVEEKTPGEKAIIFAKYSHEIEAILESLQRKYGEGCAVPFYGKIAKTRRQENLARFSGGARFLVANKACAGYGLNLQFCRNVIYYSNDWDYATRIQSEDRVHRMGQEQDVRIIDICARHTLDEKIMRCLTRKEGLSDAIKREIKHAEGNEARGAYRKWLYGEMGEEGGGEDGEDLHNPERVRCGSKPNPRSVRTF